MDKNDLSIIGQLYHVKCNTAMHHDSQYRKCRKNIVIR